jgi:hypothetical protein
MGREKGLFTDVRFLQASRQVYLMPPQIALSAETDGAIRVCRYVADQSRCGSPELSPCGPAYGWKNATKSAIKCALPTLKPTLHRTLKLTLTWLHLNELLSRFIGLRL